MRNRTLNELESRSRQFDVEEERARRMRAVFEETDALSEAAVESWRRTRRLEPGTRRLSFRAWVLVGGLLLGSGSALAWGGPRVLAAARAWATPETTPPAERSSGEPRVREAPKGGVERLEGSVEIPERPSETPGALASTGAPEPTFRPQSSPRSAKRADDGGWGAVTEALERGDLGRARVEAERLGSAGSGEARDAARLVALQLALRQTGRLEPASREELGRLARSGASGAIRREAARLLELAKGPSEGSFE